MSNVNVPLIINSLSTQSEGKVYHMTNVSVSLNINTINTESEGEIFDEKFHTTNNGESVSFPKIRTVLIEQGVQSITFEVDFKKLNNKRSFYELNSAHP